MAHYQEEAYYEHNDTYYDEETPFVGNKSSSDSPDLAPEYESNGGCRDMVWAIAFLVHLAAMLGAAALTWRKGVELIKKGSLHGDEGLLQSTSSHSVSNGAHQLSASDVDRFTTSSVQASPVMLLTAWATAALTAAVFAVGWMVYIKKNPDNIIKISVIGYTVSQCIVAVVFFGLGMFMAGGITLLLALFAVVFYKCSASRIPFTQAMLKSSVASITDNKGIGWVAVGSAATQMAWLLFWVFTALSVHAYTSNSVSGGGAIGIWVALIFSMFWTCGVVSNVAHVTVAGAVSSWWLVPSEKAPTTSALKRAMTTSFGSVCLGSLIVAVLDTLRSLFRMLRNSANDRGEGGLACLACVLECCVECIEDAVEYINKYAYAQVAIYGKPFMTAARDTWELMKERGWSMLINDDLTGFVIMCGTLAGGFVGALSASVVGLVVSHSSNAATYWLVAIVGFFIGMFTVTIPMTVVSSAVATTFVVWAQFPGEISANRPQFAGDINTARERARGYI